MEMKIPKAIEGVMDKTIKEAVDGAETVTNDRRSNTLSVEYYANGCKISVQIQTVDEIKDLETREDIEREVMERLQKGQKQMDVARQLGISQGRVSGIKKSYNDKKSNKEMVRLVDKDEKKK